MMPEMITQAEAIARLRLALDRLQFFYLHGEMPPQEVIDYAIAVDYETTPSKIIPSRENLQ